MRLLGDAESEMGVLLDDDHGGPLLFVDRPHDAEQFLGDHGGEPEGRLVQKEQPLVRLSVGIETIDDLLADLSQALG
jgi:hypothetical protein